MFLQKHLSKNKKQTVTYTTYLSVPINPQICLFFSGVAVFKLENTKDTEDSVV